MPSDKVVKRSVSIAGHSTSISLEEPFWEVLCGLAKQQQLSVNQLVQRIDAHRTGNLSSAIRLHILREFAARIPDPSLRRILGPDRYEFWREHEEEMILKMAEE